MFFCVDMPFKLSFVLFRVLVNKTWARVIKEGVWGNKRARKTL